MVIGETSKGHLLKDIYLSAQSELSWYAVQTCARHEKRVQERLDERAIECFLPLYEMTSRWKDRNVRLQLPLFPGYVFVHMDLTERLKVLQTAGVVKFVGFGVTATPLPNEEMATLRRGLLGGVRVEPYPYLKVGRRARVKSGPFQGMVGILLRRKNAERFVISLDAIARSMVVEVDVGTLSPL